MPRWLPSSAAERVRIVVLPMPSVKAGIAEDLVPRRAPSPPCTVPALKPTPCPAELLPQPYTDIYSLRGQEKALAANETLPYPRRAKKGQISTFNLSPPPA